jgi:hypothetical protein
MDRKLYVILLLIIILATASCKKDTVATESTVVYQNSLTVNDKTWITDSTSLHVRKFYQNHYSIKEDSLNQFESSLAPFATINYQYSVKVDAATLPNDTSKLGYVGIIFNYVNATQYSIFEITNNGTFSAWTYNSGTFTNIVGTTFFGAIRTANGIVNTIQITQNYTTVDFQINNVDAGSFPSALLSSNVQVGVLAGAVPTSESVYFTPVTGLFNNFSITKIN